MKPARRALGDRRVASRGLVITVVVLAAVALISGGALIWFVASGRGASVEAVGGPLGEAMADARSAMEAAVADEQVELNQAARADLDAALASAREALDQTTGQVSDEQVRSDLAARLDEADTKRSTTFDSRIRLPNISRPTSGTQMGASTPATTVTTMGKSIKTVLETGTSVLSIRILRSCSVVSSLMTGGWIMGTSAMYE